jgi:hypothetical protein
MLMRESFDSIGVLSGFMVDRNSNFTNYSHNYKITDTNNPLVTKLSNLISSPGSAIGEVGENLLKDIVAKYIDGCKEYSSPPVDANEWAQASFDSSDTGFGLIRRQAIAGKGDSYGIDLWCGPDPMSQTFNQTANQEIKIDGTGISMKMSSYVGTSSRTKQAAHLNTEKEVLNALGYVTARYLTGKNIDTSSPITYKNTIDVVQNGEPIEINPPIHIDDNLQNSSSGAKLPAKKKLTGTSAKPLEFAYDAFKKLFILNNQEPVTIKSDFIAYNMSLDPVRFDKLSLQLVTQTDPEKEIPQDAIAATEQFDITMSAAISFFSEAIRQKRIADNNPNLEVNENNIIAAIQAYDINNDEQSERFSGTARRYLDSIDPDERSKPKRDPNSPDFKPPKMAGVPSTLKAANLTIRERGMSAYRQYKKAFENFNPPAVFVGDMSIKQEFSVTVSELSIDDVGRETMTITVSGQNTIGKAAQYTVPHFTLNIGGSEDLGISALPFLTAQSVKNLPSNVVSHEKTKEENARIAASEVSKLTSFYLTGQGAQSTRIGLAASAEAEKDALDSQTREIRQQLYAVYETLLGKDVGSDDQPTPRASGLIMGNNAIVDSIFEIKEFFKYIVIAIQNLSAYASGNLTQTTGYSVKNITLNPGEKEEVIGHLSVVLSVVENFIMPAILSEEQKTTIVNLLNELISGTNNINSLFERDLRRDTANLGLESITYKDYYSALNKITRIVNELVAIDKRLNTGFFQNVVISFSKVILKSLSGAELEVNQTNLVGIDKNLRHVTSTQNVLPAGLSQTKTSLSNLEEAHLYNKILKDIIETAKKKRKSVKRK